MTKYIKFIGTRFADILGVSTASLNQKLLGKAGDDVLLGGNGNDKLKGGNGDDWTTAGGGNDDIDGGKGFDTAVYRGRFSEYSLTFKSNLDGTVQDLMADRDGADMLKKVEFLKFSDGIYDIAHDTFEFFNRAPTLAAPAGIAYNDTAGHDTFSAAAAALSATDPDGDTLIYSLGGGVSDNSLAGYDVSQSTAYGTMYLNSANGSYTFVPASAAIEALKTSADVDFTLTAFDDEFSDSKTLTVTLNGVNDSAAITGTAAGAVAEDGILMAGGTLTVSDPDSGDAHFQTPALLAGSYGSFTFDAATGVWGYTLANGSAAVQHLAGGTTSHDTLTVTSADATASRTIDVAVSGANDAPALQVALPSGPPVLADDSLTLSATMAFSDIDFTDTHSVTFTALGSGYIGDFTPTVATDSIGGIPGSVALSYHLTKAAVDATGGHFPAQQDYRVTIDDLHGGTSSQIVSIPLAQLLNDIGGGGGGGGGGTTTQPPVFINTSPPNPFISGRNLGTVVDDPFILHPSVPWPTWTPDLSVHGTLNFSDPDGGNHHASVDLAHAMIVGHFIVDSSGVPHPVPGAPTVNASTGTWQVFVQEPGQVFWSYTLPESAIRSMAGGESQTMIFPITVYEDGVGHSTQNVRIDLLGTDEPTSLLPPDTVLTANTDISPYLLPIDLATHLQMQNFSITEAPSVTGSTSHHTLSGTITFVDPDRLDRPTVSMTVADMTHTNPGDEPFNAAVQPLMAGFHYTVEQFGNYGMIHWTYDVEDSALDFLARDSTLTASATFNIGALAGGPGGGGSLSTVNVNLIGANDEVTILGSNTTHVTGRSASGTFTFTDPDFYPNGHTVAFVPQNPGLHGSMTGGGSSNDPWGGGGTVSWFYMADPDATPGQHEIFDIYVYDYIVDGTAYGNVAPAHFDFVAKHTVDILI